MPFPPQIVYDLREMVRFLCACRGKHTGKGMPFPYVALRQTPHKQEFDNITPFRRQPHGLNVDK